MSMQQALLGQTYGDGIALSDTSVFADNSSGFTAEAGYRLNTSGEVEHDINTFFMSIGDWILTPSNRLLYEVRVTVLSGLLSGDSTSAWLDFSTSRHWYVIRNPVGISIASFTVEIRSAGSGVILDSATVDLAAEIV